MALTLKDIYKISQSEMKDALPYGAIDFRLEEATFDTYDKKWKIVISYLAEIPKKAQIGVPTVSSLLNKEYERVYKRLDLTEDGKFTGFRIYQEK